MPLLGGDAVGIDLGGLSHLGGPLGTVGGVQEAVVVQFHVVRVGDVVEGVREGHLHGLQLPVVVTSLMAGSSPQ